MSVDNFEKASRERIAKFFKSGALGSSKWLVRKLSYGAADSNFAVLEMVH